MTVMASGDGPTHARPASSAALGEFRVFRKETIAGVDGIGAGLAGTSTMAGMLR